MKKVLTLLFALRLLSLDKSIAADEPPAELNGEYFDLGSDVQDFQTIPAGKKSTLKRVDKNLSFRSTEKTFPGTMLQFHFAIRWAGKIKIPKDGKHTFYLESHHGSRLLIDREQVLENGGLHLKQEASGNVELKAGDHDLKVDYDETENDGVAGCVRSWKTEGIVKEVVPAKALFH